MRLGDDLSALLSGGLGGFLVAVVDGPLRAAVVVGLAATAVTPADASG